MPVTIPTYGYGNIQPATPDDLVKDEHGYTNENLHRRMDIHEPPPGSRELAHRDYIIGNYDRLHSTRMTEIHIYHDDTTDYEVP